LFAYVNIINENIYIIYTIVYEAVQKFKTVKMKYDKIDKAIINVLLENGRYSCREIAKKIGYSAVTVMKRMKALEEEKVILSYSADLDYDKLGFDLPAIIRMQIAKGKLLEVEQKLARHPNVHAIFDVTGDFDAIVFARFKNRRSLDTFIKSIQAYQYVNKTQTNLILNIIKDSNSQLD